MNEIVASVLPLLVGLVGGAVFFGLTYGRDIIIELRMRRRGFELHGGPMSGPFDEFVHKTTGQEIPYYAVAKFLATKNPA